MAAPARCMSSSAVKVAVEASNAQLMREWTRAKWSVAKCSARTKWLKKKPMPPALTSAAAGTKASNARVREGEQGAPDREHGEAEEADRLRALHVQEGPHATPLIGIAAAPVVYTAASRSV